MGISSNPCFCGFERADDCPRHGKVTEPSMTIATMGGMYSIERVPMKWWQRPRWLWRFGYFLWYEPRPWDVVKRNPRP